MEYVLDPGNGLRHSTSSNGVDVEVVYRPNDLVVAQQLRGISDPMEQKREMSNFEGLVYFVLNLSRDSREIEGGYASDSRQFSRVVSHLSSEIFQDIYLLNGHDTIPAISVAYAPTYGVREQTSLLTVFEADIEEWSGAIVFLLDDSVLGVGRVQLVFDSDRISKVPSLMF